MQSKPQHWWSRKGRRNWSSLMPSLDTSGLAAQKSLVCHRQVSTALSRGWTLIVPLCQCPRDANSHPKAQLAMTLSMQSPIRQCRYHGISGWTRWHQWKQTSLTSRIILSKITQIWKEARHLHHSLIEHRHRPHECRKRPAKGQLCLSVLRDDFPP